MKWPLNKDQSLKVNKKKDDALTEESIKQYSNSLNYLERLELAEKELATEKELCDLEIADTRVYLDSNHNIYEKIKTYSEGVHKSILENKTKCIEEKTNLSDYLFFDFENNEYEDNGISVMEECYSGDADMVFLCQKDGIYIDYVSYAASSLFLAGRKKIKSDSNYINAFEKIIEHHLDYSSSSRFSLFCMLPESIDAFNTRIRRCLNTSKGKIISIPKSIAVAYYVQTELSAGERFCVVNLDGLHPVVTQLYIGKDENDDKIILREGFISKHNIKYDYVSFACEYICEFEKKYKVQFSENEVDRLVYSKALNIVFSKKEPIQLFREEGRIDVIYDEELYKLCYKKFVTKDCNFANCEKVYVISSFDSFISGENIVPLNSAICFEGLSAIRNILLDDENAIIWKEKLPRVSLEVIDDYTGRFSTIELIDENNEGQNIRLSLDEEVELPFRGTITLQRGKREYFLPLEREIYSEDVNSAKEAYFYDKSFPLDEDVPVELVVKYNYLSESPIKLYARPKIKCDAFSELANTWVDPHEIKAYAGAVYEGHPNEMVLPKDYVFETTLVGLEKFVMGSADLSVSNNLRETRGQYEYHKDYKALNSSYFQIRSTFVPCNAEDELFDRMYKFFRVADIFDLAIRVFNSDIGCYGEDCKTLVSRYKKGLSHLFSNFVVTSWYYNREDDNVRDVYEYLSQTDDIRMLSKLSRCIQIKSDDIWGVFDKLTTELSNYFEYKYKEDKFDQRLSFIRTLSQNCWFTNTWMQQFYHTENGPKAIELITNCIWDYLYDVTFRADKEYRDIMEFLVRLTMSRNYDEFMFNPNDENTRILLFDIKYSYEEALRQVDAENLVSRLEMEQDQGVLHGYHNYIYMLIVILSGEGQINLVGYHDE